MADHYDAMETEFQMVNEKPAPRHDIETEGISERKKGTPNYNYMHRGYYTV
jgi:hypothetical protein